MSKKTIGDVEAFWNDNPLFTGEVDFDEENPEIFFAEHDRAYFDDVFSGVKFEDVFYFPKPDDAVLDLGCGIGFWTGLFVNRFQVKKITSADLTDEALRICKLRVPTALTVKENAEKLTFKDESFNHVNCQGVIHHTPDTQACLNEIHRVLKTNGTASISVYYKNFILKTAAFLLPLVKLFARTFLRNTGRGRDFSKVQNADDIVRFYDGSDNPIGKAYTQRQFEEMLRDAGFQNIEVEYFFFPFRFFKFRIPSFFRRILVFMFPFMIVANVRK